MTRRRAIIYARLSQDRAGAGLGIERQTLDGQALAERLGWDVATELADNDISAYAGKPRPGYRALLQALDSGTADSVIVWHTDRLHRSPRELEEYVDLCERRKVVTQTVTAGELDLATPSGRAVARTLGAWARFESEHKAERVARAHEQAARAGKWRGGARPFGWRLHDDGTADLEPVEAAIVEAASRDILLGVSLGSIVRDLNDRGVTTSTGRAWNYTSLRQVVTRAKNAGLSELRGEIVGQMGWPPIVTEDAWRAVCGYLDDPRRRRSQSNRVRWLLAGLAVCGGHGDGTVECGERLKSAVVESGGRDDDGRRNRRTVYRCPTRGTGHVARTAQALDEYIGAVVVERMSRPDAVARLSPRRDGDDGGALRAEAVALRRRMDEAADQFADGAITAGQMSRITDRVRARLTEVESAIAARATVDTLQDFAGGIDAQAVWDGLTIERRRRVVDVLMTVVVLPGRPGRKGFDTDTVDVRWRR